MPHVVSGEEVAPPDKQPLSGVCIASPSADYYKRETCELSTEDGKVPNGFRLVIEHVSAACSTHPARGIFTLALITRSNPDDRGRMTHIPVTLQSAIPDQVRLSGAQMVRIYAGAGTGVDLLVSTWQSAPAGFTSCDVSFAGVLERVNQ
jgi:hypothetical protein